METRSTTWRCDNCGREVTRVDTKITGPPDGWFEFSLSQPNRIIIPPESDLCDSCSAAIIQLLNKRKKLERGQYVEIPLPENLPSADAADVQAVVHLKAAFEEPFDTSMIGGNGGE